MQLLKIESKLPEEKQVVIAQKFIPFAEFIQQNTEISLSVKVSNEFDTQSIEKAKEMKKLWQKMRVDADKLRKAEKDEFLQAGNYIQAIYNSLLVKFTEVENYLETQAKYQEILREQRLEQLRKERLPVIEPLLEFMIEGTNWLAMTDQDFEKLIKFLNNEKAENDAKIEAERVAAEQLEAKKKLLAERLSMIERNQYLFDYFNLEHLVPTLDTTEDEWEIFSLKIKDLYVSYTNKQVELAKAKKELQERLEKEEAEKLRIDRENQAKLKEQKKQAKLPDVEKMKLWVNSFSIPQPPVSNETVNEIAQKFESYKNWAIGQIENYKNN